MAGIVQNRQNHLIFIVVPQVRMKRREKCKKRGKRVNEKKKRKKNMRIDKSKGLSFFKTALLEVSF